MSIFRLQNGSVGSSSAAGGPIAGSGGAIRAGDSQPDLLELNAEISRMAKELRLQMMDLWTFRGKAILV